MSMTVATLKDRVIAELHGTSASRIVDFNGAINKAARQLLQDVDPAETKRTQQIANAIYTEVYDYQIPTDTKGNKIIDIKPQVNRRSSDSFTQSYGADFDRKKSDGTFAVKHNSGVKSVRISKNTNVGALLHAMNSLTDNGTWTAGNDATNLAVDKLQFISGGASIKIDLDGSTTDGYIENSDFNAQDLTDDENVSSIFLWVYFPDPSIITNINLRWGSDSSNYWSDTVTANHDTTAFQTGWNLVRFDWNGATQTSSPDSSAVDYTRITVTYDGTADTDIRFDNLIVRRGTIYEIEYYSKYLFRTSSGTWQENTTDDTDLINLDTDSFNLLIAKTAEISARQMSGTDSVFDYQTMKSDYDDGVKRYKQSYKSEVKKNEEIYYRQTNRRSGLGGYNRGRCRNKFYN